MKNSNQCPKCTSEEIIIIPNPSGYDANYIALSMFRFNRVNVTRFVCGNCGFSEDWIESPEDLEKLKEKFGS